MFIPNNDSLTEQYFEKSRHKKKENSYLFLCNIILTDIPARLMSKAKKEQVST